MPQSKALLMGLICTMALDDERKSPPSRILDGGLFKV